MRTQRAAHGPQGEASAHTAPRDRQAVLEREHELAVLEGTLAGAARGAGEIVLVEGPPGVGKTRLVADARASARRAGLRVLEARGAPLEREFAFGVARQLLEPAVVALGEPERAELFAGAAGLAQRLFDPGRQDPTGGDAGFAILHALYWLVVNLADRAPVLVSVDDAHWADAPSLRFLDYLAHRSEGLPVAIVLAGRPPGEADAGGLWAELAAQPAAVALRPQPLSHAAVSALVRARLVPDAAEELCAACHRATQGNPLFVRELLGALAARGGTASAQDVTAVGPGAVRRFVLHRLAALGSAPTELARAVAVLGDDTDVGMAGRVAGVAQEAVPAVADELVRADVLAPAEHLGFVHPIVRAAIYEDLAPGEREQRHAAAADVLAAAQAPPERVAAHLLAARPAGDDRRVEILRAAADSAARRGAPEAAGVYLRRALEEPPAPVARGAILARLGGYELAAMRFSAADEHLRAAVATGRDAATRADAASMLARCAIVSGGRSAEAAATALEALAEEVRPTEPERALELQSELMTVTASVPRLRPALAERLPRFREQAAGHPGFTAVAEIHAAQEGLLRGEPASGAVERVQAALATGIPRAAITNTVFVALTMLVFAERYEVATPLLDAALEVARREGQAARQGIIHGQRAAIALGRGALDDAQVEAETGLALIDDRHFVLPQLIAVAIVVHIERGDLDAAAAALECGGAIDEAEDRIFLDHYLTSRGRLRIGQGDVEGGVADLLECGERLEALGVRWPADWRAFAAPALASLGDGERGRQLAREQIEVTRRVGAPGALGRALRTGGLANGGDEGLALLEDAAATLQGTAARLELAHALTDLGAELGRRRRRREGREALRLAMPLAVECGASALAERARTELAAGGGRRARLELTGVTALTPAERRVCELAAEELTNRAIAQSLFVTEKTVELHLTSAYRKLGIRSRFQLGAALGS
jgi:DNA-binding CsgD family transcriptional regulator